MTAVIPEAVAGIIINQDTAIEQCPDFCALLNLFLMFVRILRYPAS